MKGYRSSAFEEVARVAFEQRTLEGFAPILEKATTVSRVDGIALWLECGTDADLAIVAQYPIDTRSSAVRIPIAASRTGEAILAGRPVVVSDFANDPKVYRDHPFLRNKPDTPIGSMAAFPLSFGAGQRGALNFYRTRSEPLRETDILALEPLAVLIRHAFDVLVDRVSVTLRGEIDAALASWSHPASVFGIASARESLDQVCRATATALGAVEVSVFMVEGTGNRYGLAGTSWTEPVRKLEYRASKDEGVTGWVLEHGKDIVIPDLKRLTDNKAIQAKYPGVIWRDSLDLLSRPNLKDDDTPIAFIGVPIVATATVGVIRAAVPRAQPAVLAEREIGLLRLVAHQLGRFWQAVVQEAGLLRKAWEAVVTSLNRLNHAIEEQLRSPSVDRRAIYNLLLSHAREITGVGEIFDIRLYDEASSELYFEATLGDAWQSGSADEQSKRLSKRFPIPGKSAGALVFRTRRTKVVTDVEKEEYYSETFPETRQMIVAPIMTGKNIIGVLDVRSTDVRPLPQHADIAVSLLGNQLGLYHELAERVFGIRDAGNRLRASAASEKLRREREARKYLDLQHQLRTPILKARSRLDEYLEKVAGTSAASDPDLMAVRSHVTRSYIVAYNTKMFGELAEDKPPTISLSPLLVEPLVSLLKVAAADQEAASADVKFRVREAQFRALVTSLMLDYDIFEHALWNVLDNADKYSRPNSVVYVSCGFSKRERFYISVQNIGERVYPDEASKCVEREWQAPHVAKRVGLGSGIGLWIADNVMRSHGGEVVVLPTTASGLTDVRLYLPLSAVGRR